MLKAVAKSRTFQILLGVLISGSLIAWMCFEIDWHAVSTELQHMHWWVFVPITAVMLLHYGLRTWRWRYLLQNGQQVPPRTLGGAIMLGIFVTYILPLRAGEVVRPLYLSLKSPIPFATGFTSVIVERFFDLSMVLLSFGLVTVMAPQLPSWVHQGAISLSILAAILCVFILVGAFFPTQLERLVDRVLQMAPPKIGSGLKRIAHELIDGVAVLRAGGRLFAVTALSILVWLSCYLQFYVSFWLFNIPASPVIAITTGVIVALAVAAPSAPGFIGVYQVACIAALALFGVSKETSAAFAIVTHLHMYIIFMVLGPVILARSKLSLAGLTKKQVK